MGMGFAANHGWAIRITEDNWRLYNLPCGPSDDNAYEKLNDFKASIKLFPGDEFVIEAWLYEYNPDNGDRYDDLEDGWYILFSVEDLFTPKPFFTELVKKHDLKESWWVTLG